MLKAKREVKNPIKFRDLAKLLFPRKTAPELVFLTGCARSTANTWLSGEHEPPAYVLAIVLGQLMQRLSQQ